jgi:hypothetical protein
MQSINFIIAVAGILIAIYGGVLSTINQLQIHRQMRQMLLVKVDPAVKTVQRTNGSGGIIAVLTIQVVNSGLRPVVLKEGGLKLPDDQLVKSERGGFTLAPGDDYGVHIEANEVLRAIKQENIADKVVVRGYFMTPLRRYESKKISLDIKLLENDVERITKSGGP